MNNHLGVQFQDSRRKFEDGNPCAVIMDVANSGQQIRFSIAAMKDAHIVSSVH